MAMQTSRRNGLTMFQRRVLVLACCVVMVNLVLVVQLLRLTLIEGERHGLVAESRLQEQSWLPTWRGSIKDRDGTELARDEPAYDVAFAYDAITGAWARDRAVRASRRAAGSTAWAAASPRQREVLISRELESSRGELEAFWTTVNGLSRVGQPVLDERRNDVLAKVQHMSAVVWDHQRRRHESRYSSEENGPAFRQRPIAEQEAYHVLLPAVDDEVAIAFKSFKPEPVTEFVEEAVAGAGQRLRRLQRTMDRVVVPGPEDPAPGDPCLVGEVVTGAGDGRPGITGSLGMRRHQYQRLDDGARRIDSFQRTINPRLADLLLQFAHGLGGRPGRHRHRGHHFTGLDLQDHDRRIQGAPRVQPGRAMPGLHMQQPGGIGQHGLDPGLQVDVDRGLEIKTGLVQGPGFLPGVAPTQH